MGLQDILPTLLSLTGESFNSSVDGMDLTDVLLGLNLLHDKIDRNSLASIY